MSEAHVYPPPPEFAAKALVDARKYEEMYAASVADPEAFWASMASACAGYGLIAK